MKTERQEILRAMIDAGGDREAAASKLGLGIRTFYRRVDEFDLHVEFRRMGWAERGRPGGSHGSRTERLEVLEHIRRRGGVMAYGELAGKLWGLDSATNRRRIMAIMDRMMETGELEHAEGKWRIVK